MKNYEELSSVVLEKIRPHKYLIEHNFFTNGDKIENNEITEDNIEVYHNKDTGNFGWVYTFKYDTLKQGEIIKRII